MEIPPVKYNPETIPSGRMAHIGEGRWMKKCRLKGCPVTWVSEDGPFPTYGIKEHRDHEMSHSIDVPGGNMSVLP